MMLKRRMGFRQAPAAFEREREVDDVTVTDLAKQCAEQINLAGPAAQVCLVLPGKWTKSGQKRLCPGGPVGQINGEAMDSGRPTVVVFFGAMDILAFLTARGLIHAVGPDGLDLVEKTT